VRWGRAVLVGFTPGRTGAAAAALLAEEGLELRSVQTGGEVRSTAVVRERSGRVSVMNDQEEKIGTGFISITEDNLAENQDAPYKARC
jgi:fructose-1-phosphate kinase PfkB-like protein